MEKVKLTIKAIFKSVIFWIIIVEVTILFTLYILGFRITYSPKLETSWNAVAAVGQWAGALVGLLIPIAAVYLQSKLDKNKMDIGESNSELFNEFKNFKIEYSEKLKALSKLVDDGGNIILDANNFFDNNRENLKEKALKFVNISMVTKTKRVAEHLDISKDEAFDLLVEMVRHDESISAGGQLRSENMDNIVWTKRSK